MRLYPPVTQEEALEWLRREAKERWGELSPALEETLPGIAKAMAAVSAADVPEDIEPLLLP